MTAQMTTNPERDAVLVGANHWLQTLQDWVRIPSVSADPAHRTDVLRSAQFLAEQLRHMGFPEVQVLDERLLATGGAGPLAIG